MVSIRHQLLISAPVERIYAALTTPEGLSGWWTPGVEAKPELNSIARFPFGPDYNKEMSITSLNPAVAVTWKCIHGAEEWVDTTLSFELVSVDKESVLTSHPELGGQLQQQPDFKNGTVLIFSHNWKAHTPMFAECSYTWALFLRSLKLFCETGKGRPWPLQHRAE